jgi:hypothetical protein
MTIWRCNSAGIERSLLVSFQNIFGHVFCLVSKECALFITWSATRQEYTLLTTLWLRRIQQHWLCPPDLTQAMDKNRNTYKMATTDCKFLWLLAKWHCICVCDAWETWLCESLWRSAIQQYIQRQSMRPTCCSTNKTLQSTTNDTLSV